jgi:hypothetical protein
MELWMRGIRHREWRFEKEAIINAKTKSPRVAVSKGTLNELQPLDFTRQFHFTRNLNFLPTFSMSAMDE